MADELCQCGHPASQHQFKLMESPCVKGKVAIDEETPVWVMCKPCKCAEFRPVEQKA